MKDSNHTDESAILRKTALMYLQSSNSTQLRFAVQFFPKLYSHYSTNHYQYKLTSDVLCKHSNGEQEPPTNLKSTIGVEERLHRNKERRTINII